MKLRIAYCDDETEARQIFDVGILDAFSRQNVNAALADYADPPGPAPATPAPAAGAPS